MHETKKSNMQKVVIAGVLSQEDAPQAQEIKNELIALVESAGAEVAGEVFQFRDTPDAALFIGKGKAEELKELCLLEKPDLIIFNNDLRPLQERNLSEFTGFAVLSRQALILDIFAQRARSAEGKLQVELAQLEYLMPRLTGFGVILSRLGGGIGTRGPGETKLEVDRRHIRNKISILKQRLEKVKQHRELLRKGRHHQGFLLAALVGYTNAGKSTLLNSLTGSEVLAAKKLFATLDPTTRKVYLKTREEILLVDTVGLIRNLPHQLVAAFHATLEEIQEADILLHVIDVSHPEVLQQIKVVEEVLEELAADHQPVLPILNKIDLVKDPQVLEELKKLLPNAVAVSAKKRLGFEYLLETLSVFAGKIKREQIPHYSYPKEI